MMSLVISEEKGEEEDDDMYNKLQSACFIEKWKDNIAENGC